MNSLNTWFFGVVIIPWGIKGCLEENLDVTEDCDLNRRERKARRRSSDCVRASVGRCHGCVRDTPAAREIKMSSSSCSSSSSIFMFSGTSGDVGLLVQKEAEAIAALNKRNISTEMKIFLGELHQASLEMTAAAKASEASAISEEVRIPCFALSSTF